MTTKRSELVDSQLTRWFYCIVRCVRRAQLLSEGEFDRKQWVEDRLEQLAAIFAVSIGGFAVHDDQIQILLRVDPDAAAGWTAEEVVRRWGKVVPPRDKARQPLPVTSGWVRRCVTDEGLVALARQRLQSLSWFMKCLKERLSRLANREDQTRGTFFEGRFKSVAVLDPESLLAACVFIDLSLVAAGVSTTPRASAHTSIALRCRHRKAALRAEKERTAGRDRSSLGTGSWRTEQSLWLCPIEQTKAKSSKREGMFEGLTLADYQALIDFTGRLFLDEESEITPAVQEIMGRFGTSSDAWQARLLKLSAGRFLGRFFAADRQTLRSAAQRIGVHRLANLDGCEARSDEHKS